MKKIDKKDMAILAMQDASKELNNDTINNLSAYTIKNLSADTINNLSAYTIKNLSADTIKNLSADTINNLSADTINNLSADTMGIIQDKIKEWETIPVLEKPYTKLWNDIKDKKRVHKQSDWGPESCVAEDNICGTAMCTAGHLVNMAGIVGYQLKDKYGWRMAAMLIHQKSSPDLPCQNFGNIPQEWALAYIEEMANRENK